MNQNSKTLLSSGHSVFSFFNELSSFYSKHGFMAIVIVSVLVLIVFCIVRWYKGEKGTFTENLESLPLNVSASSPKKRIGSTSKGEQICRTILEKLFRKPFIKVRPDFLKNHESGKNMEMDLYNKELNLCVEYNGMQHYIFSPYFHKSPEDYNKQVFRDKLKAKKLKEHGICLIVVPYSVPLEEIEMFLRIELKKNGYTF